MALQKDSLWIARSDLADFRDISSNIADAKIEIYIREAQSVEIRNFLGDETYTLMQSDYSGGTFPTQKWLDLWEGVDYTRDDGATVRFNGLGTACVYWSYARFLIGQQTNVSRFGVQSLQDDISEDIPAGAVRTRVNEARGMAIKYQKDAENYLTELKSTYSEWYSESHPSSPSSSFGMFKL